MPYRVRLRKRGEANYHDIGELQPGLTPRHSATLTIEVGAGVIVGRIANVVRHRVTEDGSATVDTVYVNEV